MKKTHLIIILAIMALLLGACGPAAEVEQDQFITIWFQGSGHWKMEGRLVTNQATVVAQFEVALGDLLTNLKTEYADKNVVFDYTVDELDESSNMVVNFKANGPSIESLANTFNGLGLFEVHRESGQRVVTFTSSMFSLICGANPADTTLTLYGGEIRDSNGEEISSNAVQWTNPTLQPMQATLTEAGNGVSWWLVALIIFLFVAMALVVLALLGIIKLPRRASFAIPEPPIFSAPLAQNAAVDEPVDENVAAAPPTAAGKSAPAHVPGRRYCIMCGTSLPKEARFCSYCGMRQE